MSKGHTKSQIQEEEEEKVKRSSARRSTLRSASAGKKAQGLEEKVHGGDGTNNTSRDDSLGHPSKSVFEEHSQEEEGEKVKRSSARKPTMNVRSTLRSARAGKKAQGLEAKVHGGDGTNNTSRDDSLGHPSKSVFEEHRQEEEEEKVKRSSARKPTMNVRSTLRSARAGKKAQGLEEKGHGGDGTNNTSRDDSLEHPSKTVSASNPQTREFKKSAFPPPAMPAKRNIDFGTNDNSQGKEKKKKDKGKLKVTINDSEEQSIQMLESFKDSEIYLLNKTFDYQSEKGRSPAIDQKTMDDFIKNWLQVNFPTSQVMDDMVIVLKKYQKIKLEKNLDALESRDRKAFEMADKIWGNGSGTECAGEQKKQIGEERKNLKGGQEQDLSKYEFLRGLFVFGCDNLNASMLVLHKNIVKEGLGMIKSSKLEEVDNKWMQLQLGVGGIEMFMKQADLIKELSELLQEALKSQSQH